jgi:hypothetical protein
VAADPVGEYVGARWGRSAATLDDEKGGGELTRHPWMAHPTEEKGVAAATGSRRQKRVAAATG